MRKETFLRFVLRLFGIFLFMIYDFREVCGVSFVSCSVIFSDNQSNYFEGILFDFCFHYRERYSRDISCAFDICSYF